MIYDKTTLECICMYRRGSLLLAIGFTWMHVTVAVALRKEILHSISSNARTMYVFP
jgi:hypothetical protein